MTYAANLEIHGGGLPTLTAGWLQSAANKVANPEFETNTTGWSVVGTAVVARSTVEFHGGAASGQVTVNAASGGMSAPVTLVIGGTYTFSAWVKVPTGKTMVLKFLDAAGTPPSPSVTITGLTGVWQQVSVTYVAGATSVTIQFIDSVASAYPYDAFIDSAAVDTNPTTTVESPQSAATSCLK